MSEKDLKTSKRLPRILLVDDEEHFRESNFYRYI